MSTETTEASSEPPPAEAAAALRPDDSAGSADPVSAPEWPLGDTTASLRADTEALLRTFADEPGNAGAATPEADDAVLDIARIFETQPRSELRDDGESRPFSDGPIAGDGADSARPPAELDAGEADASPGGPIEAPPADLEAVGPAQVAFSFPEGRNSETESIETVSEAQEASSGDPDADASEAAAVELAEGAFACEAAPDEPAEPPANPLEEPVGELPSVAGSPLAAEEDLPDPADAEAPAGPVLAEADTSGPEPASAGGDPERSDSPGNNEPPPVVTVPLQASVGESRSAQTARMLLDIMSMPSGASQPQERALAGDTLLRLVDGMTLDALVLLSERLSLMEAPPALLVRRLLAHPRSEVAAPLLERCTAIADQDLIELAATVDLPRLRMIARRRHVSTALADALIRHGDSSLDLTLIRNPNARFSHEAFSELGERATHDAMLQAPLATRADTPAPVAFALFWYLPAELRRYVLSRFLTDSVTLERILSIARGMDRAPDGSALGFPDPERLADVVDQIEEGAPAAAAALARLASICEENARRIIADPGGEPLMVAMKALGLPRARFGNALERWRRSDRVALCPDRDLSDLQALFDSLSFNKARVLLTYWDWAELRSGPYERRAA